MRLKHFFFLVVFLSTHLYSKEPSVCLTMIVKNESAIIERCLNSIKDIADCISICDTGSTDNTVEIIEKFLEENQIRGEVHHHTWKNFGHNRSLSTESAKRTLEKFGFSLSDTYLLLLDADMVLAKSSEFKKENLKETNYRLIQKSPGFSYYNVRLINASLPWECVGVTHEYWQCQENSHLESFKDLWIDDLGDGGCKTDKFERDISLLTKGLEENPFNSRYMFYLAQSYKDINKPLKAIEWYRARIAQGGWKEEVWYSKFMIGTIYEGLNEWDKALDCYLDAYQYFPSRSEPLSRISRHYRLNGEHHLSHLFAAEGVKIPYPEDHLLFISTDVYDYLLDEDISIASYYTAFGKEGLDASERLMLNKRTPFFIKKQAEQNSKFYVGNLENLKLKPISMKRPLLRENSNLLFNSMNPSVLKTENGYYVVCRSVNYEQSSGKHYQMIDPEERNNYLSKTRNFLLHYDKNFNLISQKEIVDDFVSSVQTTPYFQVEGLEDIRLFEYKGDLWFTCTVFNINHCKMPQVCLFRLSNSSDGDFIRTDHFVHLKGPEINRCEKNWLPFVKDDQVHLIYSYDPFQIYQADLLTGECRQVLSQAQENDFSKFRGSSGPIAFDDGYLSIVHYVVDSEDEKIYFHRFLYLNKDYKITHMSKPFTYTHQGVEFCCGMTLDHFGSSLVMAIGLEDAEAFFAFLDLESVRQLLIPIQSK